MKLIEDKVISGTLRSYHGKIEEGLVERHTFWSSHFTNGSLGLSLPSVEKLFVMVRFRCALSQEEAAEVIKELITDGKEKVEGIAQIKGKELEFADLHDGLGTVRIFHPHLESASAHREFYPLTKYLAHNDKVRLMGTEIVLKGSLCGYYFFPVINVHSHESDPDITSVDLEQYNRLKNDPVKPGQWVLFVEKK